MKFLKNLSLMALSGTLLFTACKKDDDKNGGSAGQLAATKTAVVGMWMAKTEAYTEYDSTGTKTDEDSYPYEDNELVIQFTSNNSYTTAWDDGTTETGKFELKEQTTKYGTTGYYLSIFMNNSPTETDFALINLSGNSLTLNQFDTDLDSGNKEYLSERIVITLSRQ